jgi:hypothetical protein
MWNTMSTETAVVGRDWERWRAIMTVARLFEQHGVAHLTSDMLKIMSGYQEQKDDLEGTSRIVLVIRALMRLVKLPEADKWTSADVSDMSETRVRVQASQVVDMIKIALQEDSEDEDEGERDEGEVKQKTSRWPNAKAVGIILSKLRLPKDRETSSGRVRHRLISQKEVLQLAIAHHLVHLTNNMSDMSAHVHMSDDTSLADGNEVPPADTLPPHGADGVNGAHGAAGAGKPTMSCPTVGDWVLPLSEQGDITADPAFPLPYLITKIEQHSDGQCYARFLETGKYWPLAQCENTDPPMPPNNAPTTHTPSASGPSGISSRVAQPGSPDGTADHSAENGEGDMTQGLQAGDWVWLCAANGDRRYLAPCQIDTIDCHTDGTPYARFLNMVGEWSLAQCQRADPPAPATPPANTEDF